MQIEHWLKDRTRWLLNPVMAVNLTLTALAVLYGYLTLGEQLAEQGLLPLVLAALAAIVAVNAELRGLARLQTLRAVGLGAIQPTPAVLLQALGEVHRLPDRLGRLMSLSWLSAVAALAAELWLVGGAPLATVARVAAIGALAGGVSATLVNLMVMRRARVVVEAIGAGLAIDEVIAALPPPKERVRARLVALTVGLVLLPSAMLVDAARQQTSARLTSVLAGGGDRAAQVERAQRERLEVYARLALLVAGVLGAALLTAWAAGSVIAEPMRRVASDAAQMARGELGKPQLFSASDDVWALTSTFSLVQAELHRVLAQVQKAGVRIAATTGELVGTTSGYEAGAAAQAASLNQTSATTEQLAQTARQISANATEVSEIAQRTLDSALAGQSSAEEFARAVERMRQDNRTIAEAVGRLQGRVQQIGKIVEFITNVADRSDLLALSAELEGTKAGEVGRSFSLVAAEMRRLAENVLESTTEIEELIGEVRDATSVTVTATEHGLEQTTSGTALASEVARALVELVRLAKETSSAVRGITLATQQQQTGTDQLAEAMTEILGITQRSLAATKQLGSANTELVALSGSLSSLVERWKSA